MCVCVCFSLCVCVCVCVCVWVAGRERKSCMYFLGVLVYEEVSKPQLGKFLGT